MKTRSVIIVFFLLTLFVQCVQVKEMDDNADIASCDIIESAPQAVIFNNPEIETDRVVLPMEYGKYEFPVTVALAVKTKQTIDKILGFDPGNTLVFETPETVRKLHFIAQSGVVHTYEFVISVKERSDLAEIRSVELHNFSPDNFLIAPAPILKVASSAIEILGIDDGGDFPLTVSLTFKLSDGASIENGTDSMSFTFNNYEQETTVVVKADSGKKQVWTVCLKKVKLTDAPSQTDPDTWERMHPLPPMSLTFQPPGPECSYFAVDSETGSLFVDIRPNHVFFPWVATFSYGLSPFVQAVGLAPDDPVTIESWNDNAVFYLVDVIEHLARKWTLKWHKWLNTENAVTGFMINKYESSANEMVLGDPAIDPQNAVIEIPVESGKDFPLYVTDYNIGVSDMAVAVIPDTIAFPSYKSRCAFSVISESGAVREWTIKPRPWFNTQADIESFAVNSYHSREGAVRLKSNQAAVNREDSTVTLVLKAGYDFPMVIDAFSLMLSDEAVLEENYANGISFNTIEDIVPLTVVAESSDKKHWSLRLSDERTENKEALVLSYYVKSYNGTSSTPNNMVLEDWGVVDTLNKTVTLIIKDWSSKMPLTVNGVMAVSKNASISSPEGFGTEHRIVFNAPNESHSFTVTSESKTKSTFWTIKLEDRSVPRSNLAQVTGFVSGEPSTGFDFAEKYLEPDKNLITLLVKVRPSGGSVLTINPRISVSPNARLTGIVSGAPMELSFDTPLKFRIQAQDESVQEWTVKLLYAPQVYNSGYELWGNVEGSFNLLPSDGKGWTTGNNTQISGTARVTGYQSTYAAQMVTQLKTMNLVVYKVTSLAAGAVLLGKFTLSIDAEDVRHPSNMTAFGIPFTADTNPVGFEIDYKYVSGGQRVYTEPKSGVVPAFKDPVNVSGPDKAVMATEVHHLAGGAWKYDLVNKPTMIAGYELYTEGAPEWTHARVMFTNVPGKEDLKMTHLVVRMTSSYQGDLFKGADKSTLTVDNFKLVYYEPSNEAVLLD